jgi:hypothetical protein
MLNILPTVMAVAGSNLPPGSESIQQMIVNGDAIFRAILAPCKIFSAVFVVIQAITFFSDGGLSSIEKMTENISKVLWAVIIVSMISGTASPARAFGIYNYAVMVGIDKAIGKAIGDLQIIDATAREAPSDARIIKELDKRSDNCRRIAPQIYDAANPTGVTNPAFTQCINDLKAYGQQESANIKNEDARNALLGALNPANIGANIGKFFDDIDKIGSNLIDSALGATFKLIFAGWVEATGYVADQAVLVSLLAMPIPLTMSLFNPEPLKVWFSSLWAVGIFKICMTILTKSALYLNGIYSFQDQQFTQSILLAFFAPAIASLMAAGGGIGVMKALGDVAGKTAELVGKVAVKAASGGAGGAP